MSNSKRTKANDFESKKPIIYYVSCTAGAGNNPMVGMTVSVAVAVEEAIK